MSVHAAMKLKIGASLLLAAICIGFLVTLIYGTQPPHPSHEIVIYYALLLTGMAGIYWLEGAMYFYKLKNATPDQAITLFTDFIYPLAFLVLVSVLLMGFFSVADVQYSANYYGESAEWARFGSAIVQVFPDVFFPVGVVMYAFWGAFIYNNYHFIRRIIDDDFTPRVLIMGTIRIVMAIFASILVYFAFFSDVYTFTGGIARLHSNSAIGAFKTPGLLIVASFFSGLYPRRFLNMIYSWLTGRLSQWAPVMGQHMYTPLTMIQGVTLQVEDRLNEEGIDSIQALANCDVDALEGKHRLPYPRQTIVDWKDQAKLAIYFDDEKQLAALRCLGLRTYTGLQAYQTAAKADPTILDNLNPAPIPVDKFRHFVLHGVFPPP